MKCIICRADKDKSEFSDEHIFPDSIGGRLVLKEALCTNCNSQYGRGTDSDLVNHELVKLVRLAYQIKGKSGKVPNPFERGHVVGEEDHKVRYELDKNGNPKTLYTIPKIEKTPIGNDLLIEGHIDKSDAPKLETMIKSICKRQGMEISESELEKIRNPEVFSSRPEIRVQAVYDLVNYKKGILKIAYELAYYWLGEEYLDDPIAKKIRSALMDARKMNEWEGVYDLRGRIDFIINEKSLIPFWDDKPASHIGLLIQAQDALTMYIRIFKAFEGIVVISIDPARYSVPEGRFIEINVLSGEMIQTTYIEQVAEILASLV